MKYQGSLGPGPHGVAPNRVNLISADATNLNHNPRLVSRQLNEKGDSNTRQSSINRND